MNNLFESQENYMGKISWSKTSCGSARNFFGSEIKSNHPISVRISQCSYERGLSHDWYHAKSKPIVEIELTPIQWAEFLTSGNTDGIPCTIIQKDGIRMNEVPQSKIIDYFEKETFEHFEEFERGAENIEKYIQDILDSGKPMRSKEMKQLLLQFENYKSKTISDLKYVKNAFKEQMSEIVTKAKSEVNAFVENKIMEVGIKELKNNIQLSINNDSEGEK